MRFLEDGDKAKVTIRFRGREMAHQELGMQMLERLEKDLEEHGTVEARLSWRSSDDHGLRAEKEVRAARSNAE